LRRHLPDLRMDVAPCLNQFSIWFSHEPGLTGEKQCSISPARLR
jgi:hypothetical protein